MTVVVCPAANVEHELVPTCPVCNGSLERHEGWDGRERDRVVPDRRTLILGQAPGRAEGPPLGGRVGARLASLAGVAEDELSRVFALANLLPSFPGKAGKGDAFPLAEAREAAERLSPSLVGRRVVLLGRNVATAFGARDVPPLSWIPLRDATVAVLPHPSGINLWWNAPSNVAAASAFLRAEVVP